MREFAVSLGAELRALTDLRRRVVAENDTLGRLFASMKHETAPPPTWAELEQAERALEAKLLPGLEVRYVASEDAYGLFPMSEF